MTVTEDKVRPWGAWLQQRREELGISLEQAEQETRIRLRYLVAMEAGELEALPDPVVGRGFLRNYARYLELDPEEAAQRFPEEFGQPGAKPVPVDESSPFAPESFRPVPLHKITSGRSRRWFLAIAGLILVAALAVLGWWAYPRLVEWWPFQGGATPAAAETATRQVTNKPLVTETHTPTTTAKPTTSGGADETVTATPTLQMTLTPTITPPPTLSPTPSPQVYTGIFLELLFTDTSWIQVSVDGVRQFQGELGVDTYRSWYGEERIELRIGNAGVVQVTVNGQLLGALGEDGEVVDRVFEKVDDGVSQATVTPLPSGSATAEPTTAPSSTPTAVPSSTPTTAPTTGPTAAPTPAPPTPADTATIAPTGIITPTATP